MTAAWRLLTEDGVAAAAGLATDELLAQRAGAGTSPPTLRLYTYRAHCALVGRFQNVAHEVHVPFCTAHGIDINRRPTGGGAILMGPDQLGVALALRGRGDGVVEGAGGVHGHARALMQRFSAGIVAGLDALGIAAGFRGKNDLEVGGRKIAGLGIHRDSTSGLLFHASLLVDLDVALMARVLRLPGSATGALDAAELAVLRTRTTTVRACRGSAVTMADVRAQLTAGFAAAFGVEIAEGRLDAEEHAAVAALARTKYSAPDWLHQETAVHDAMGVAAWRTPGGTVEARVALAGNMLKSVSIRGDFFADASAVADLEARLRWQPVASVAGCVAAWARGRPVETVTPGAFAQAIAAAVHDAQARRDAPAAAAPYGCFVAPGAPRG